MNKLIASVIGSLLIVVLAVSPAESALYEIKGEQVNLSKYPRSSYSLSTVQQSQIDSKVKGKDVVEKVICTGVIMNSYSYSQKLLVRKRAKLACEYAKLVNPNVATWYQSKVTKASSMAGRVMINTKFVSRTSKPSVPSAPTPSVAPSPSAPATPAKPAVNNDMCKLQEVGRSDGLASAFPGLTYEFPKTGKVNVALVFLEWGDLKGTSADRSYWLEQASMFEDFYYMVSEGKLDIEIKPSTRWFNVGPTYVDYKMSQAQDGGDWRSKDIMQRNGNAFISASDPSYDFTGVDAIIFAIPTAKDVFETGPHAFGHNKQNPLRTNEGVIYDWISAGTWFIQHDAQPSWVYYAHEFGHSMGLIDFRDATKGDQREKYLNNPMGGYEIMDNQGGPTRTMTAWVRWLQGWLDDNQVTCIDSNTITNNTYRLDTLNDVGADNKAIVIKTSATTAIVVESRRWDAKFDVPVVNSKDGLIVYTVDATKGHSEGPLRLVSPRSISRYLNEPNTYPDWRTLDVVLYQGNSVTVDGVTITLDRLSSSGDIVRISK